MASRLHGVYLPIVTPFYKGQVDLDSYERLIVRYLELGVYGLIPLGTTGEAPTIDADEYAKIVEVTVRVVGSRVPIFVGIGSNDTRKAIRLVESLGGYAIEGFLVTSPYYSLPSQRGIYEHFSAIAQATDKSILIYNIPYRTGRNVENETILRLSKVKNIVGIKDSCGSVAQSIELLREREGDFSVLTGEDILFYFNLIHGGDGGILASAHVNTESFVKISESVGRNDHRAALQEWNRISKMIPLLFAEPNPGPIKYILGRKGWIRSDEVRLPLAPISDKLKGLLDALLEEGAISSSSASR